MTHNLHCNSYKRKLSKLLLWSRFCDIVYPVCLIGHLSVHKCVCVCLHVCDGYVLYVCVYIYMCVHAWVCDGCVLYVCVYLWEYT